MSDIVAENRVELENGGKIERRDVTYLTCECHERVISRVALHHRLDCPVSMRQSMRDHTLSYLSHYPDRHTTQWVSKDSLLCYPSMHPKLLPSVILREFYRGLCLPTFLQEHEMKTLFGRKVAIDASMSIYQFLIAVRQKDGELLTNDAGETTRCVNSAFVPNTKANIHNQVISWVSSIVLFVWWKMASNPVMCSMVNHQR